MAPQNIYEGDGKENRCPVKALTGEPENHFYGYYDKRQFDSSGSFALGLACDIFDRMQEAGEKAELGMVDLRKENKWIHLASTKTWNWQFGCLSQWMPGGSGEIIYNDSRNNKFISVIIEVFSGEKRELPYPVFDIHPDGKKALTVNFKRLAHVRPETGFAHRTHNEKPPLCPDDDGLFSLDLKSGRKKLLISLSSIAGRKPANSMRSACHYITHPLWNEKGSRFLFWHRWREADSAHKTVNSRVYTADADGKNIFLLIEGNSHTTWHGSSDILIRTREGIICRRDQTQKSRIIGEQTLTANSHFTLSPDKKWLSTDTPPDKEGKRAVILYNWNTGKGFKAAEFATHASLREITRCDPHPRFHPSGRMICVDSAHEGTRQMYAIDISGIVDAND